MTRQKTILVTGANRGIGLEFVRRYVEQGWNVIATTRDGIPSKELSQLNVSQIIPMNCIDEESITALGISLAGQPIDLLINNAGVFDQKELKDITMKHLTHQFQINAFAPILITQALLPSLKQATLLTDCPSKVVQIGSMMGSHSRIVDILSQYSYKIMAYSASKGALTHLSQTMAEVLKVEGIAVAVVHPGLVQTDMNPQGELSPEKAVTAMMENVITKLSLDSSGWYCTYSGETIPY